MSDASAFLQAEEKASQLVEVLSSLRREVEHYDTASRSLEEVRDGLKSSLQQEAELAEELRKAVIGLREIGTQKLIDGQDAIRSTLDEASSGLISAGQEQQKVLSSELEEMQGQFGHQMHDLGEAIKLLDSRVAENLAVVKSNRRTMMIVGAVLGVLGFINVILAIVQMVLP